MSPTVSNSMTPYLSKSDGFKLGRKSKLYLFSKEEKLFPEWLPGHNLVKKIVAYDKSSSESGVRFLATDWNDAIGAYQLSISFTSLSVTDS